MKARVKETGETFVVYGVLNKTCDGYAIGEVELLVDDHDSFQYDMTPAYWEKLRHQCAGMAMQGMLTNPDLLEVVTEKKGLTKKEYADKVACVADIYATALVEKLKSESNG